MNFYNTYLFFTLLYSLPSCVNSMENKTIYKFVNGEKIKEFYYSDRELNHLQNIDLNSTPPNNNYTTEDESETTKSVENVPSDTITASTHKNLNALVIAVEEEQYFNYFNENIQPIISKNKTNRDNITSIAKRRKISVEESCKKYDNTLLIPFTQANINSIIRFAKQHGITIEEATNHFLNQTKK